MGQSISAVVDDLQQDAAKEKLANDAMNSLIELAKMQVEAFELAIRATNDTQVIPIDKILEKDHVIQCNIDNEPSKIGDMISDTFSAFVSGDILGGVSKLINSGLKVLLGSYSGNTSSRDSYAITCGQLGGISRLDMHFYSYRYTSSQLTDIAKQVLCVSIVRSSVDPTKLSDATLRNIVQNTYSSSTLDEQTQMYNQLAHARDTDLQSRSMNSTPVASPSIKTAVALANKYTHPSMKLTSKLTNGSASPAVELTEHVKAFAVTLQMNTASQNVDSLKNWIEGYLYAGLGAYTIDNGMVVTAEPDVHSSSNSGIVGTVVVLLAGSPADMDQKLSDGIGAALQGAVSDKCPIPAINYTIDGPPPSAPGEPPNGTSVEIILPDDDFSDVEDLPSGPKSGDAAGSEISKPVLKPVSKVVRAPTITQQQRENGAQRACDLDCFWETDEVKMQNVYIYPKFTSRPDVPAIVQDFFKHRGSHVHIRLNRSVNARWKLEYMGLTIRHPGDWDKAVDTYDSPLGGGWYHIRPEPALAGTVTSQTLKLASLWWRGQASENTGVSDAFTRLENDAQATAAYLAEWALLENNVVDILNTMFGEGAWNLNA